MGRKIDATVRLRRDNDYNFNKIKHTFVPANGEVILVDTATDGLRAKVGNGYSTYYQLPFVGEDLREMVQQGYYYDGVFYKDATKNTPCPQMINKVYIDKPSSTIYYFNGENYVLIGGAFSNASDVEPGIMKLYNSTGYNTDGTMTQKSITDELELRYKASIEEDDELLIFTI